MYLRGTSPSGWTIPTRIIAWRIRSAHIACVMFRYLPLFCIGRRQPLLNSCHRLCAIGRICVIHPSEGVGVMTLDGKGT